jgi:hypothetical protein
MDCAVRTIWRDLAVLQEAGLPIYDERAPDGRRGLWRVDSFQDRLPIPLSLAEIVALLVSRDLLAPARFGPLGPAIPRDDHDRQAFRRRRRRRWEQHSYWFVSAEDLVLQKLKVGRPRDFEDAAGVIQRTGPALDAAYLRRWASRLGIAAEFEYMLRP